MWVTSGRIALAHVFRRIGIGPGCRVLIPVYNCQSMVSPVAWLGGEPAYYRVNADLSPNMSDLERLMDPEVKCLLIAHYFGFPMEMEKLTEFASKHEIPLVEDCAHALFGSHKGRPLGSFGDYAICSPWKFLPLLDGGGALARDQEGPGHGLSHGPLSFQAQVLLNSIENSLRAGRMGPLTPACRRAFQLKDAVMKRAKGRSPSSASGSVPESAHGSAEFQSEWMNTRMSRLSRFLMDHVSLTDVAAKRRENYHRMLEEFASAPHCRPLRPHLFQDVVPYVFPLYVEGGDAVYHYLRENEVPVFRWDEIPEGVCDVASDYQYRLIQLPVHQELLPSEVEWMIEEVHKAMTFAADGSKDGKT